MIYFPLIINFIIPLISTLDCFLFLRHETGTALYLSDLATLIFCLLEFTLLIMILSVFCLSYTLLNCARVLCRPFFAPTFHPLLFQLLRFTVLLTMLFKNFHTFLNVFCLKLLLWPYLLLFPLVFICPSSVLHSSRKMANAMLIAILLGEFTILLATFLAFLLLWDRITLALRNVIIAVRALRLAQTGQPVQEADHTVPHPMALRPRMPTPPPAYFDVVQESVIFSPPARTNPSTTNLINRTTSEHPSHVARARVTQVWYVICLITFKYLFLGPRTLYKFFLLRDQNQIMSGPLAFCPSWSLYIASLFLLILSPFPTSEACGSLANLNCKVRHYYNTLTPSTMAALTPKISISKFSSGDPVQWDAFVKNFNNWVTLLPAETTRAQKKAYLLTHLEGTAAVKAADIYGYVADNGKTLQNTLDDLTKLFAPAASGDLAMSLYHSAKQQQSESVESWHTRLKSLYKRAFPEDDANASRHLVSAFVQGLYHQAYKPAVLLKRPQTYPDALRVTQEVIAALSINDPRLALDAAGGNLAAVPGPHQSAIKHEAGFDDAYQFNAIYSRSGQAMFTQRPPSPRRPQPSSSSASGITCYFCNTPGHRVADCQLLRSAAKFLNNRPRSSSRGRTSRPFMPRGRSPANRSNTPTARFSSPARRSSPGPGVRFQMNSLQTDQDSSEQADDSTTVDPEYPCNDDDAWLEFLGEQ